ncbi:MAG: type II secretion system major pseudopilin GspG [Caulobacteraceae bacterium]
MIFERSDPRPASGAPAFTLTEMLVVLVIIGLIAAIVGPRLFNRLDDAKRRTANLQITNLAAAVDLYRIDIGRIPTNAEGLDALLHAPSGAAQWLGPYLARDAVPSDPWGRGYVYKADEGSDHFVITSYGADGQPGGSGAATDIVVSQGQPTPPAAAAATPVEPSAPTAPGPTEPAPGSVN